MLCLFFFLPQQKKKSPVRNKRWIAPNLGVNPQESTPRGICLSFREPTSDDCIMWGCKHWAPFPQLQPTLRDHLYSTLVVFIELWGSSAWLDFSTALSCYREFAKPQSLGNSAHKIVLISDTNTSAVVPRVTLTLGILAPNSKTIITKNINLQDRKPKPWDQDYRKKNTIMPETENLTMNIEILSHSWKRPKSL